MPASAAISRVNPRHFSRCLFQMLIVVAVCAAVAKPAHCQDGAPDRGDTPEILLRDDLREALSLLKQKRFRMLAHDFLPSYVAMQKEYKLNRSGGDADGHSMSDASAAELASHLNAALDGKKFYNRNKTLVEISYVRQPVEIAPEIAPGTVHVFGNRPSGQIKGLGADLQKALASAVEMLESGKITEFIEHAFPLPDLARISEGVSLRRYAERMAAAPRMVEAMIRDLKHAAAADIEISDGIGTVQVPSLADDNSSRTLKFELVEGNWRFHDGNRDERETQRRLATAKIGSVTAEKRQSTMMLIRYQDNWRLISMPTGMSTED